MYRVVLVTAVCAAACAEVPDRREDPRVTGIAIDPTTMEIAGGNPSFALEFSPTGVRLPSSFVHNDTEMLATDACPLPSLAGVSLAPMTTAVGGRQVAAGLEAGNTITALWTGPVVAQVVVGYQVQYDCNGKQLLDGTSTFTVFPSGRVVRTDAVKPTQGAVLDTDSCGGCQGPGALARFEAFWALASGGERVQIDSTGAEQMVMPTAVTKTATACALYPTHGVAMTWTGTGQPSTEARGPLEFRYDFVEPATTIDNALATARSVFAFGPSGRSCTELADDIAEPTLVIDGKPIDASPFGIYEVPDRLRGPVEVRTQNVDGYGHGIALRFEVGTPDHLRIEHASGGKVEFDLQPDGATAYIIWLPNGVPHDDPIVIEAS